MSACETVAITAIEQTLALSEAPPAVQVALSDQTVDAALVSEVLMVNAGDVVNVTADSPVIAVQDQSASINVALTEQVIAITVHDVMVIGGGAGSAFKRIDITDDIVSGSYTVDPSLLVAGLNVLAYRYAGQLTIVMPATPVAGMVIPRNELAGYPTDVLVTVA